MTTRTLPADLEGIVLSLCEGLATPISLSVAILVRYREYDQIAVKRVDPMQYLDAEHYAADQTAVSFLCKLESLPTTFDKKKVALNGFFEAERACYVTNERLSPWVHTPHALWEPGVVSEVITEARKRIASILGRPPREIEGRFGPGATFGDRGKLTTVADKMSSRPTLTSSSCFYLLNWVGTAWATACAEGERDLEFVRGNRFTTVPKDCTKDRGIAVEPSVNLFYQLGLGRIVRERLRRSGIDLNFGQDIHRRVACEASIRGHLATIDLSNASDTICSNLVKLLLPPDWYLLFEELRSPYTLVEGRWVKLEKFSSMGNGYTFELETLLFLSLCHASITVEKGVSPDAGIDLFTFGDDIIVPSDSAEGVLSVLQYFGMTPNKKKTFLSGPFRESCGGDFFGGVAVRPHFQKEEPREPQHFIAMANGLRRLAFGQGVEVRFDTLRRTWFRVLDSLPSAIRRLRGPEALGDLLIHDFEDKWEYRLRHSIRYFKVWRPAQFSRVGWDHFRPGVVLACAVYGTGDGSQGKPGSRTGPLGIMPRDSVLGYKVGWVPLS